MSEAQAIEMLIVQLQHGATDNPDAEWQAAIALGEVQGQDRTQAVAALLAVLDGGQAHALTRTHTVEALGKLDDRRALPSLLKALHDSYRLVRAYAATAVGAVGDERAVEPLLAMLERDDFFGARAEAVCALARLAEQSDAAQQATVRRAFIRQRQIEERAQDGSARVIAEIDRALARLTTE